MSLNIVILAAGQGKRMQSSLPKVLHLLAGKPLLKHVIDTANELNPANIFIVYGHGGEQVRAALADQSVKWIEQKQQLGTGHALLQAMPQVADNTRVLVLFGDVPLIAKDTLQKLLNSTPENTVGVITAIMPDPSGLGRILRNAAGELIAVVEDKDAAPEQKQINEINTGILVAPAAELKRWLPQLKNNNAQGEYYYPEIIPMAVAENMKIQSINITEIEEGQGINDRVQLSQLERYYQHEQAKKLMLAGVTLLDPARFDLRGEADIAVDVTIDINVILEGKVIIGKNTYVGSNVILKNVTLGNNVNIKANTVIEDAVIADDCVIGPFARIRPETELKAKVHIGNFVEVKKSTIAEGSKVNHLSYVGDATLGKAVNIGAGTITCNYDGINKHKTTIGDNAFIGSNSSLIAPMTIGDNATIGAGSTISCSAPADQLTVARAPQRSIEGWKRPAKKQEEK